MNDRFNPGSCYHIYNHAIGKENLFLNTENYRYFLRQYDKYLTGVVKTFCYCLMPNHFHILIQIEEAGTLLQIRNQRKRPKADQEFMDDWEAFDPHEIVMLRFKHFLNGYAQAYNKMYERKGGLFLRSLKRKEVSHGDYFLQLVRYIHGNPVHHGFCNQVGEWRFSSYHSLLSSKRTRLEREWIIDWFGSKEEFLLVHQEKLPDDFESPFD